MKNFVEISEAMYKHFIDVLSQEFPNRYEITFDEDETKTFVTDLEDMTYVSIRHRYPQPSWSPGYEIRRDYYDKYFPELK